MKATRLQVVDPQHFTDADLLPFARLLAAGGTVAFPTETVYGLGADATNPAALSSVFAAKGRPSDNPLIVHVAAPQDCEPLVRTVTPLARVLIARFWPGPLTIVLQRSSRVPDLVTAGLETVAVRLPAHPLARRLIALAGVPIAAPSANRSGRPSPTRSGHVVTDLMGRVDGIIDGGPCAVGLESTVVDATGAQPVILRPGGVTREMMASVAGPVAIHPALTRAGVGEEGHSGAPRSPGMKYTHYAPRARLVLARTSRSGATDQTPPANPAAVAEVARVLLALAQRQQAETIGILCTDETAAVLGALAAEMKPPPLVVKTLGSAANPEEMAANLFLRFREFDDSPVTLILAQPLPEKAIGHALMNRLEKAAGHQWEEA